MSRCRVGTGRGAGALSQPHRAVGRAVSGRRPDGYTLILGTQSTNASNMLFFPNLPYDPIKDFQPLTLIGTACMALVTAPNVPANTPKEFVEWAKKQDGGVSYASAAPGSSQHV